MHCHSVLFSHQIAATCKVLYMEMSCDHSIIAIVMQGRVLDSWGLEHNAAATPPQSPVKSSNPMETITLIPFGSTDLRIAEFPVLDYDEE